MPIPSLQIIQQHGTEFVWQLSNSFPRSQPAERAAGEVKLWKGSGTKIIPTKNARLEAQLWMEDRLEKRDSFRLSPCRSSLRIVSCIHGCQILHVSVVYVPASCIFQYPIVILFYWLINRWEWCKEQNIGNRWSQVPLKILSRYCANKFSFIIFHRYIFCYFLLSGITWAILGGIGVTGGAHRLWAHRSYKAKWPLRVILMIFQTVAFQVSLFYLFRRCCYSPICSLRMHFVN